MPLRQAWASEASDFTPWLAQSDNLRLLGEAVEMELELVAQEQNVGPFRADILCREVRSDALVLIENQLERTDHGHLGQLLTYAAGLNAVSIIWIAERFAEQHRAALDWLNQKTPEGIALFGLEVEAWRIGASPMAPKFNVVCRPNEWTRAVAATVENTELHQFCLDFWSGVISEIAPSGILLPTQKPVRKQDIRFAVGWDNFWLKAYFSRVDKKQGVWLACKGPNADDDYEALKKRQEEIDKALGEPLTWTDGASPGFWMTDQDANDRSDWPRQHKRIAEKVIKLYRAARPLVDQLDSQPQEPADK